MGLKKRGSTVVRRNSILKALSEKGEVFVDELSEDLGVSTVTIRNDLDRLESKNMLLRARGGAMSIEGRVGIDFKISDKSKINYDLKARIGKAAAKLINESDTIIIDSGSTTSELIKNLGTIKNLTIITNALNIANMLVKYPEVNVIIPGGYLRKNSMSLVGPLAQSALRNFHLDKAFLGVDGFDTKKGIYTPNIEEARLNEIMIEVSTEVILLADSSKFKRKSLAFICPLNKIHTVITDEHIEADDKKRLDDAGIKVIIA